MRLPIIVLLPAIVAACEPTPGWNGSIESLLMAQPDRFAGVMQNPEKFRLQVVYTQIDRDRGHTLLLPQRALRGINQLPAAAHTVISTVAPLYPVVARGRHVVRLTGTLIAMPRLSALRNAIEI